MSKISFTIPSHITSKIHTAFICEFCSKKTADTYISTEEYMDKITEFMHTKYLLVCSSCIEKTNDKLFKIEHMPINMVPLLINDSNPFVKHAVKERLKSHAQVA